MTTRYLGEWRGFRIYADGNTLSWGRPGVPDPGPRGDLEPGESFRGDADRTVPKPAWRDSPAIRRWEQACRELAQRSLTVLLGEWHRPPKYPDADADRAVPKPDDGDEPEPPLAPLAEWLKDDHGIRGMK